MSIVKCKECGGQVSTKAAACPGCGALRVRGTSGCAWIGAAFLGLFLISLISVIVQHKDPTPAEEADNRDHTFTLAACNAAKDAVSAQLLAPASATFPNCVFDADKYQIRGNADRSEFSVIGYVDSQNRFGAKLRKKFVVMLALPKGADPAQMAVSKVTIE